MHSEPKRIIKSFLGKENLSDVSKDEIRSLAEKHPYSALIQYLLTRRLQVAGDPGYADSVARTAIYFHNPHWLSLLLRRQTSEERVNLLEESLGLTDPTAPASSTEDVQLEEETDNDDDASASMAQGAKAEIQQTLPEAQGDTEEVIPIQPLHTLDYFASVGVNIEQDAHGAKDPKMQRFSDWLRSMKPIHPTKRRAEGSSLPAEEAMEQGGEESILEEEILTEAMAEIYEKQGLRLKAIAVYSKLSLLHPDKSSIFAAKIEQLKGIAS